MGKELGQALKAARLAKGLTLDAVGKVARVTRQAVGQWESGDTEPATENLIRVCALLSIDMNAAAQGRVVEDVSPQIQVNASSPKLLAVNPEPPSLVRYSSAFAGHEGGVLLDEVYDRVKAPPQLENVPNAYACYVYGESMEPRYFAGETVFCHPNQPYRRGDFVIIQVWADEAGGQVVGLIKQFVSRSAEAVVVRQFNPDKEISFPLTRIKDIHRIVASLSP